MPSAIEFFLTHCIQRPEAHPKGWEWWVLDREGIHQDILHILFSESPSFAQTLLGHDGTCTRQPSGGAFDLVVQSASGIPTYLEIKVDHAWSSNQCANQIALLKKENAKGLLILFSQRSVEYTRTQVQSSSGGLISKVSYADMYRALDDLICGPAVIELRDFAAAYKVALQDQERRTREYFPSGDPNE
jgi:tRNA isopentenyl-2-thiomethyl-A-37 hydroxylase MiaE